MVNRPLIALTAFLFLIVASELGTVVLAERLPLPQTARESKLDFQTYRTQIEPIFLKKRENGVRCYDCHSTLATPLRLERLSASDSSWTEEQSRKNLSFVAQLVMPGNPNQSRLLLHPLAVSAGGDPVHTGGKFWHTKNDPEWQMIAEWISKAPAGGGSSDASPGTNGSGLDFAVFRSKVQPIFLKERGDHARCYGCHTAANRVFRLVTLSPGATDWTEEQSRQNFQSASRLVSPQHPESSRLLLHPLAPEAGGDAFHSGGRQFASREDPDWIAIAEWVGLEKPAESSVSTNTAAPSKAVRIYITNSAGSTLDVIDPALNQVVQVIRGIELPHGVVFSPDGSRVYVSNESESVLDVVDSKSAEILKKVPLVGHPNNLTITKDGARVLVGIREDPGMVDVIDAKTLQHAKTIAVDGSVHNIFVTPDGKYAISGSIENKAATVIDLTTDHVAWKVKFDRSVRPIAFEANPDGSTKRMFVQLSGLNGFAVVDFAAQKEVARITLPDHPGGFGTAEERQGTPSHGIGVTPDGKSLWVNSTLANAVFKYSLPALKLEGYVELPLVHPLNRPASGSVPEWITFTPDSERLFVSNSGARSVSVIDTKALRLITVIPVGEVPKRINTLVAR